MAMLASCEQSLANLRVHGGLPTEAADHLDGIVATARSGDWDSSVKRLHAFMSAHRREGVESPPSKSKRKRGSH